MQKNSQSKLLGVALVGLMTACGGGSSGNSSNDPAPSPSAPPVVIAVASPTLETDNLQLFFDESITTTSSTSIAVMAKNNLSLRNLRWQQISGESVSILADRSQVISFDVPESGNYQFQLNATLSNGQSIEQIINLDANEAESDIANIRLDHVAPESGKVSLRVDDSTGKTVTNVNWEQIAGPTATNVQTDERGLFFDAPDVSGDQLLEFQATISFSDGNQATDHAYVLVKDTLANPDGYFPRFIEQIVTTDMFAYRADSPRANALLDCLYNNQVDESCRFSRLPLIGQEHSDPSIEDILDRLIVSHEWMGDRFAEYLENSASAEDMLKLLRATTGIVISYDIRPSFYWAATGAIYLDARNFWVTPEERDTLNDQPDFRSAFGNDLQFIMPWRYIRDNQYYFPSSSFDVEQRLTKTFEQMEASIVGLMYHELAHANDFFPPSSWQNISNNDSPRSHFDRVPSQSERFSQLYPLNSTQMKGLAEVRFFGEDANQTQRNYSATDIESFFTPDNASVYYSYSSIREDYANLFEAFMMSYRMQAYQDVAILDRTDNPNNLVTWGQRSRFNQENIQPRTAYVVERILPDLDVRAIQSQIAPALLMRPDVSWFDNVVLEAPVLEGQGKSVATTDHLNEQISNQESIPWLEHRHEAMPKMPNK